ncbi:MAG: SDR family NAD(P)-dependent oxidoreductase [Salibacteraceae bacterium]
MYSCFENKVVIVTGGASGMGLSIAKLFLEEKAHVVVVDTNADKLSTAEKLLVEAKDESQSLLVFPANVSHQAAVKEIVSQTIDQLGTIDILINAAGVYLGHSIEETTDEEFDELIGNNLKAPFLMCRAVVPQMKRQNRGTIVNISSIGGVVAMEGSAAYVASKTGLAGFTRALGLDLAPVGIRVNGIAPGWTKTPMTAPLYDDPNISMALLADTPMGRFAEPEEQAKMALWLASDQSSFVTGQTILNDGGWTLR